MNDNLQRNPPTEASTTAAFIAFEGSSARPQELEL